MGWFCTNQIERSYEEHESKSAFVRILITILSNVIHAIQSPEPYQYKTHLQESMRRTGSVAMHASWRPLLYYSTFFLFSSFLESTCDIMPGQ